MGSAVSFMRGKLEQGSGSTPIILSTPPSYIDIPSPLFSTLSLTPSSPREDPFNSTAPPSPALTFYTAPSSPLTEGPPHTAPQPSQVEHIQQQHGSPHAMQAELNNTTTTSPGPLSPTDDAFPMVSDISVDLALDDEGLSTLEKIYLFSRSKATFHRVFIAHALPSFLEQVTPVEAVEYVLPLLSGLAMDEDETVKEALAAELVPIVWWFLTHCQIMPDDIYRDDDPFPSSSTHTPISVQAFTPILGTLLLSPNGMVGGAARYAVVDLLSRMRKVDGVSSPPDPDPHYLARSVSSNRIVESEGESIEMQDVHDADTQAVSYDATEEPTPYIGLFGKHERDMFENEILQQVVIGMGRLENSFDDEYEEESYPYQTWVESAHAGSSEPPGNAAEISSPGIEAEGGIVPATPSISAGNKEAVNINPYFPVLTSTVNTGSPASSTSSTPSPIADTSSSSTASTPSPAALAAQNALFSNGSSFVPVPPVDRADYFATAQETEKDIPDPPIRKVAAPDPMDVPLPATPVEELPPQITAPSREEWVPDPPRLRHADLPSPLPGSSHTSDESTAMDVESTEESPSAPMPGHSATSPIQAGEVFDHALDIEDQMEDEQAAVGRLSSMSLMAAVTASGSLAEDMKHAFVAEVERVGHDPVYWVRREASFTLGALAKVVPQEIVHMSLLPVFNSLRRDPIWHVRHSALFALAAILARLDAQQRRSLALDTIMTLSTDDSASVRSGVLEALGEVIYTFHQDEQGPPEELVRLFMGRKEDKRVRDGQQQRDLEEAEETRLHGQALSSIFGLPNTTHPIPTPADDHLESFFTDSTRPLICAFNYPAVALTLGPERWSGEFRDVYRDLAENRSVKVRKTLAASLGELAKIIGSNHAQNDLLPVWWDALRGDEDEVRSKALACITVFLEVLNSSTGVREEVVSGVLSAWGDGLFSGWRERETVAQALVALSKLLGQRRPDLIRELLRHALEDNVAAVREAAITSIPQVWMVYESQSQVVDDFAEHLRSFLHSELSKRRMTFIACQQALIAPIHGRAAIIPDDEFWANIAHLAVDPILGVRIGLARLTWIACDIFFHGPGSLPTNGPLSAIIKRLSYDSSHEVRSFALHEGRSRWDIIPDSQSGRSQYASTYGAKLTTFSRPPPTFHPSPTVANHPP